MLKKNKRMTTPNGKAMWAKVLKPDTKFNTDGIYSIDFVIKQDEADELVSAIAKEAQAQHDVVAEEFKSKGKHADVKKIKFADNPFVEVYDKEGNQTGELKFKFKLKATGKNKDGSIFTQKPMLFDSEGKEVSVDIWNGSTVKVAFEIVPFYTSLIGVGVSLRLKAVQIIDLVESSSGGGANAFGFKQESGYVASNDKPSSNNVEMQEEEFSPF